MRGLGFLAARWSLRCPGYLRCDPCGLRGLQVSYGRAGSTGPAGPYGFSPFRQKGRGSGEALRGKSASRAKTVRFSSGIAQAQGAEGVHAPCLIAITQRAGRVATVGAVPQDQSRHSPFAISAIAALAIFAVTDQLLVRIYEEMYGCVSESSWPRAGQGGAAPRTWACAEPEELN